MSASFATEGDVNAIVADIGHYSTRIGWAGDDTPRSYFRSNVAVLKEDASKAKIKNVNYDYYTHPINGGEDAWEVTNPIHRPSGLLYDPHSNESAEWYELIPYFFDYALKTGLPHANLEEHPLILSERSYNTPAIRQQTVECLFEELKVPAAFLAKDAALMCFGSGRTTATVIDLGHSGTTVTPVFDGYAEPKAIRRSPTGVYEMDRMILEQLEKKTQVLPLYQVRNPALRKPAIHAAAMLQLAQECRELNAGAAVNTTDAASFHAPNRPFTLPDGTIVDIPSKDRFAVSELVLGASGLEQRNKHLTETEKELKTVIEDAKIIDMEEDDDENDEEKKSQRNEKFSQDSAVGISKRQSKKHAKSCASKNEIKSFSNRLLKNACRERLQLLLNEQLTSTPVASMVCDAAYRCDREQHGALLGHVVIGGGGSCLGPTEQAVPDFLRDQIEALIHKHTPMWRVKMLTPAISERAILAWLGGSILGSLGSFHEMWISKEEYEEWGTAIVNRKCP